MESNLIILATYNVSRFEMKDPSSILKLLEEEKVDICGLQEVPGKLRLDQLLSTQSKYVGIFDNLYYGYGNAIIYNKMLFSEKYHKLHIIKRGKSKKGVLEVILENLNNKSIHIYVTHLDHRNEFQRLYELNNLFNIPMIDNLHFLIGDFNSLKRSDYSQQQWDEISQTRINNDWELPTDKVIKKIESRGYIDLLNPNNQSDIIPTSRFNTRVDYIFTNNKSLEYESSVINNNNNQSDHKPVMVKFNHC